VTTDDRIAADPTTVHLVDTSNLPQVSSCVWPSCGTVNGVRTQVAVLPLIATGCDVTGDACSHHHWLCPTAALADSTADASREAVTDPRTSPSIRIDR